MNLSKPNVSSQNQLVILDCDGTLYPADKIPLSEIKQTLRQTAKMFGITPQTYEAASVCTRDQHPGLMNFILKLCCHNLINFQRFSQEMSSRLNYTRLSPDPTLLNRIRETAHTIPLCIFTNNSRPHLDNVLTALFHQNSSTLGIPCFSIEDTFDGHWFHPKQSGAGLQMICAKMGTIPNNAILFDDTPPVLKTAAHQGLKTCLVTQTTPLSRYLHHMTQKSRS